MSLATLNGATATRLRVPVPAWGRWWADVDLAEPEVFSGAAALVLADQALTGTILSGGAANGRAAYRVVGGAAGWGKTVPARAYADDGGVRLRTVLGDVAREVGETMGDVPNTLLGPHYVRQQGPASAVLNELAPRNWHVDFAGVTRIGLRAETTYTGAAPRVKVDPGALSITLAVDTIAGLLPGVIVDGRAPATDVEFNLTPERLTARVMAGQVLTARLKAWADIVAAVDPRAPYRATYEFRVVTQEGERLNLQPVYAASNMPDLAGVPVRPGVAGWRADVFLGEQVLVVFADADPSRPQVISHEAADAPGWVPIAAALGGPGALPIAYQTSPVQCGPFSGTVVLGSTLGKIRP